MYDTLNTDKDVNNFVMRLREWYGWHFPEMAKIVPDNELSANDAGAKEALRARTTEIREVVFTVENDGFPIEFSVGRLPPG